MSRPLPAQILDHIFHKYDSRFRCKERNDTYELVMVSRIRQFDARRLRLAELLSRSRIRNKPEVGVTTLTVSIPTKALPAVPAIDKRNRLRSNAKRKFEMSFVRQLFIQRDHLQEKDYCLLTTRTCEIFDSCGSDYRQCLGKPDSVEYDAATNCNVHRVYRPMSEERIAFKMQRIQRIGVL